MTKRPPSSRSTRQFSTTPRSPPKCVPGSSSRDKPRKRPCSALLGEYTELFARTTDEYLKERLADVRDVIIRLNGHLTPITNSHEPANEAYHGAVILIANELVPSHVITLGKHEVSGIVTQAGGRTSHAAILARSRGIPAVSGVEGAFARHRRGRRRGRRRPRGRVVVRPDVETQRAYRRLQREFVDLKDALAHNRDQPAVSADGQPVELMANISNPADAPPRRRWADRAWGCTAPSICS